MVSKSQVLDTKSHGYQMLFRDAVKAVERAMRRKWGNATEIPLMSHSLSHIDDNGRWHVADIGGHDVAIVTGTRAMLVDELIEGDE